MYQVLKMVGDAEPWWFLEGWEEDIVAVQEFATYPEAYLYYKMECSHLAERFPKHKVKQTVMSAFWNEGDQIWCEECDEYLQQYHSLMIREKKEAGLLSFKGGRKRRCQLK